MMDNEITIIDGQEYSEGQEAIVSKRIKVNDQKLSAIASHKRIVEEKEEPVKVIESVEEKQEIKEEPVVEEEPYFVKNIEIQKEEPVMEFAYKSNKIEEEIAPEKIREIKDLENAYKGQPKPEFKKVIDERPVKEEKKITSEKFLEVLDKDCYSSKARQYKESIKRDYQEINSRLESQMKEIESIINMYKAATKTGNDLQETKSDSQAVINGINSLKLDFLIDRKDEKSVNVLKALEDLFNENKEIIISTTNELKKNDERKKEIGKNEQISKTRADKIKDERDSFEESHYQNIVELNERDEKLREANNGLTEFTGIMDKEVSSEPQRETVTNISSMESPAMNRFESLREQPVAEEPKTVVGINSFMNNDNYDSMSFGGRTV